MVICCESCKRKIKLRKAIDPKKYDGEIYCQECNSVWHVKLANSKIQGYKFVRHDKQEFTSEEIAEFVKKAKPKLDEAREEERKLLEGN